MNEETLNTDSQAAEQQDEQLQPGGGQWSMPEPVYRQSSGYLPQGFEKRFGADEIDTEPGIEKDETLDESPDDSNVKLAAAESVAPTAPAVEIEPQPDLLDEFEDDLSAFPEAGAVAKRTGTVGRVLMVLIALIIAAVTAFLVVVVIWYVLSPRPDATIN